MQITGGARAGFSGESLPNNTPFTFSFPPSRPFVLSSWRGGCGRILTRYGGEVHLVMRCRPDDNDSSGEGKKKKGGICQCGSAVSLLTRSNTGSKGLLRHDALPRHAYTYDMVGTPSGQTGTSPVSPAVCTAIPSFPRARLPRLTAPPAPEGGVHVAPSA
ncbi:hypothetical protein LX36DRAFT_470672 [Colletotrichum falcatum]|nr:hypothetical protein LX36DRAFT_470672 [Colletotrichum falcatum]